MSALDPTALMLCQTPADLQASANALLVYWAPVVPHLAATFCGWRLEATVKNHLVRRNASLALHAVKALLALIVLGVLSPWFIVASLIGWAVVGTAVSDGREAGKWATLRTPSSGTPTGGSATSTCR
ncbi:hypothetical protein ABZ119_23025 [Streptomyces sp. NPDC006288]|uniref:hypothetical protein n=1 Tax=Streptomyces sp. NPDC006288 TaxID=3156743 RepID=UPI0033ACE029